MPAIAEPIDPTDIRVIDGDTIRIYHQQPNVRLVGFNAPETRRADCTAEFELGSKVTRRLRDIIKLGNLEHVPPQLNQGDSRGAEDGRV